MTYCLSLLLPSISTKNNYTANEFVSAITAHATPLQGQLCERHLGLKRSQLEFFTLVPVEWDQVPPAQENFTEIGVRIKNSGTQICAAYPQTSALRTWKRQLATATNTRSK